MFRGTEEDIVLEAGGCDSPDVCIGPARHSSELALFGWALSSFSLAESISSSEQAEASLNVGNIVVK